MVEWRGKVCGINRWLEPIIDFKTGKPTLRTSKGYRRFKESISATCYGRVDRFDGYVDLFLKVWLPRDHDTDNILKPVCDGIADTGVIIDDNYIRHIKIERFYAPDTAEHVIQIELVGVEK